MQKVLGVEAKTLTPNELISAILKAPVDLLYNGGIGTYVKSSRQSHAEVGDRANDAIRVNGADLRCKVVAEGGNLGFTQLGRVEYALAGGRINTDAIDNSAGVDCSDHEVNIKILLDAAARGSSPSSERNKLLADMTDEVAALVLRDNYFQTQSLSVSGALAPSLLDAQERFIRHLEKAGRLNRALEFLPDDEEFAERRAAKLGLTSPERAVLLAYAKIALNDALVDSDVPDDPFISTALERYFPAPLREPFRARDPRPPAAPRDHRHPRHQQHDQPRRLDLRAPHAGGDRRRRARRGARLPHRARGVRLRRSLARGRGARLQGARPRADRDDHRRRPPDRARARSGSCATRAHLGDLTRSIGHFQAGARAGRVAPRRRSCPASEKSGFAAAAGRLEKEGVPAELARRAAGLRRAVRRARHRRGRRAPQARHRRRRARLLRASPASSSSPGCARGIGMLAGDDHWQALAKAALRDDLAAMLRASPRMSLQRRGRGPIAAWKARNAVRYERFRQILADLRSAESPDLAMLSVAMRELRNLAR